MLHRVERAKTRLGVPLLTSYSKARSSDASATFRSGTHFFLHLSFGRDREKKKGLQIMDPFKPRLSPRTRRHGYQRLYLGTDIVRMRLWVR